MIKNTEQHKRSLHSSSGYAMLFAVVVVSIVSMIAMAMSNSAYKQIVLSSIVHDSQIAFYQAEMGAECALYIDKTVHPNADYPITGLSPAFNCGKDANGNDYTLTPIGLGSGSWSTLPLGPRDENHYYVNPSITGQSIPCFDFAFYRNQLYPSYAVVTQVDVNGYNSCNLNGLRTVQRAVQVTY